MKKKGFTIAEVLIAMAIVGVVSALTIPTMTASYRKQSYASALSTAVSNFETAMTTMMMKEGVDNLLDTQAWTQVGNDMTYRTREDRRRRFASSIGNTLSIKSYTTNRFPYGSLNRPSHKSHFLAGGQFSTKSGVEYNISIQEVPANPNERDRLIAGTSYTNKAADVYIDINGANNPNILGRDLFKFELGDDGHLYPFGGRDYCIYNNIAYQDVERLCKTNREGDYCAAYLMSNGYKMDY